MTLCFLNFYFLFFSFKQVFCSVICTFSGIKETDDVFMWDIDLENRVKVILGYSV